MNFDDQLKKAITRGQELGNLARDSKDQEKLSAESLRNRHSQFRLQFSDYIEAGLKRLVEHFPGFEFETVYGERGWGGAVYRDDITRVKTGKSGSFYSRLEITVRPANEFNVVNIAGKGTIHNKELFNWNFFRDIPDVTSHEFEQKIDAWILVYAEKFASM